MPNPSEMTDAELGAGVREIIKQYPKEFENDVMCVVAIARIIAGVASKMGGMANIKVGGLEYKGKPVGDWTVTVKQDGVDYDDAMPVGPLATLKSLRDKFLRTDVGSNDVIHVIDEAIAEVEAKPDHDAHVAKLEAEDAEKPTYTPCDECGEEIPDVKDGFLMNRHHKPECSLYSDEE